MADRTLTWAQVPPALRTLARWVTIAQAAGYGVSLAFARQTARRFLAAGAGADAHELLLAAHSHLLGMTALFALSGACFALCAWPRGRWKAVLLATPFAAIMVAFTAIWLMAYAPGFAALMLAANAVMAVVFYVQVVVILRALWRAGREDALRA